MIGKTKLYLLSGLKALVAVAVVMIFTSSSVMAGLTDGLVAHYPFNENANDFCFDGFLPTVKI